MNRKLATDIDRALKDVAKGVEQFDEIYKKVTEADTAGKKEKAETELKTQIKKLQRTRDQIKTWISSEEIREKDALVQARRTIEIRMEQFKRAEKEAKTKAFSKEGLAQADKLDPEEQARQECRDWVNDALDGIREQKETVTADLEAIQSKKGKKNKEELDDIQEKLRQHTWHVYNLELVLRGLDNDVLDYHDVDALKDEVEYYVSSNGEPDFINDESIYESLELESKLGVLGKEVVGEVASTAGAAALDGDASKDKASVAVGAATGAAASVAAAAKPKKKSDQDSAEEAAKAAELERKSKQDQLLKQQQERQRLINEREEARRRREQIKKETEEQQQQQHASATPASPQVVPSSPGQIKTTAASIVAGNQAETSTVAPSPSDSVPAVAPPSSAAAIIAKAVQQPSALERQRSADAQAAPSQPATASVLSPAQQPQQQRVVTESAVPASVPSGSVPIPWPQLDAGQRLALFDASLTFIPKEVDSERSRLYVPQNPALDTPASFPVNPALRFENPQAFENMDVDTLFFIFYNQPGTYQQFLAGRELRKHDWRFHKQHGVWLQRHEDPSVTTTEFELGTSVYFDPASWSQKVKTNFTVEYSKLEL